MLSHYSGFQPLPRLDGGDSHRLNLFGGRGLPRTGQGPQSSSDEPNSKGSTSLLAFGKPCSLFMLLLSPATNLLRSLVPGEIQVPLGLLGYSCAIGSLRPGDLDLWFQPTAAVVAVAVSAATAVACIAIPLCYSASSSSAMQVAFPTMPLASL